MKPVVEARATGYPPVASELVPAGVAVAVVFGTSALLGFPPSLPLVALAACAVGGVYHLDRRLTYSREDRLNRPSRSAWYARHRGGANLRLLLFVGVGLVAATRLRPETWAWGGVCVLLAGSYILPLLPRGRRLKMFGRVKPFALAAAWAAAGVGLPVAETSASVDGWSVGALAAYRFFFLLPNFWLSDWPDRLGDAAAGIRTPATRLDDRRMRRAAALWSGAAPATAGFALAAGVLPAWILLDALGCLFPLFLIRSALPDTRRPYLVLDMLTAWPIVPYLFGTCLLVPTS